MNATCVIPATDAEAVREYAKSTGEGYMALLSRILSEAIAPVVRAAHEANREREAVLQEKVARAEELKRLIEGHREELRRLEREAGRR